MPSLHFVMNHIPLGFCFKSCEKVENLVNSFLSFSILPWKEFIFMVISTFVVNQNDPHVEQKR